MTKSLTLVQPLRNVRLASERDPDAAAYERGRRDGESAMNEQLLAQRAELVELHNGVLTSLRQAVPKVVHECENTVITLAIEVAQRLVAGLPVTAEMIEAAVREAMAQVEEATDFSIYLNPEDLALLQKLSAPLLDPKSGGDRMHFHSSPDVTRGGCLVQTRFGVIDARRETKVEQLKKALLT